MGHVRNAGHLDLERNGDLLLDLLGRPPGPLRDDLNVIVGDVWVSLYGQIVERDNAPREKHDRETKHQPAIVQRKIDETTNHSWSAVFWSASAFETTCWPTSMPENISCILPGKVSPPRTGTRRNLPSPEGT